MSRSPRARPYQLTLFANNYRPPSIGEESYGATGWVRNLTGFGDALSGTYADGRGGPSYSAAWSIPFGPYGTSFQVGYDAGTTALIEETLSALNIESEFTSLGLTLTQPLIDSLRQRFALGLTWADRESSSKLLGQPFAFVAGEPEGGTEVRVWRFFQDYLQRWERSVLALRSTFSFGESNIVESPIPLLTPNRDFFVWLGQFQYAHRVMDNGAQVLLRGIVQETSDRLVPLEQIAIGGVGTVRGYPENQLVRDIGYAGSVEFHYPAVPATTGGGSLTLIGFLDGGTARNHNQPGQSLASIGIGLSGRYKGLFGEIYLAHRLRTLPGDQEWSLQDQGISLQISYDIF